ncbi:uncharacterized protein LOC110433773 [Sorghum bicolor]|uniref:Uncharacterized protein n=1 Tax=Sorghum bicolor TaxID=4558 RepID=A0A1B6Q7J7_SORBI|nr:uncharacterized protein LOC110433773 [Sorghum bicolor]KXG33885.1 hypothetical protein SORBI_3003G386400 [Sorghum bicolor]|eukprot:XP_021312018.1 uncharacterized protein LOC110433773 [Sorghum bicolor]
MSAVDEMKQALLSPLLQPGESKPPDEDDFLDEQKAEQPDEPEDSEKQKQLLDAAAENGRNAVNGNKNGGSSLSDEDDYSEEEEPDDSEEPEHADDSEEHEHADDSEDQKPEHAAADDKSGGKRAAPCSRPIISGASHVDERTKNRDLQIDNLREDSRRFADYAAGTSMASEAVSFLRAVEEFSTGKQRTKKKIMETELSKNGRFLCAAAGRAPPSEAGVAAVAVKITGDSLDILLSSEDRASTPCAFLRPWLDRLRAATSGPEPTLPLHRERQEKETEKRQALFGVALAVLLALLTTAAGVHVFPSALGPWIAIIGALFWIAISCGLVLDLYGNTKLEFQIAACLSRLGIGGCHNTILPLHLRSILPLRDDHHVGSGRLGAGLARSLMRPEPDASAR